jgi:hypothetical protein
MNKTECRTLVDLAHAMWSKEQPLDHDDRKITYRAWWLILQDCPINELETILVKLNKTEHFFPTPGEIYLEWKQTQPDAEPTATQAWNMYCHLRDTINSGTAQPDQHITEKQNSRTLTQHRRRQRTLQTHLQPTYNTKIT